MASLRAPASEQADAGSQPMPWASMRALASMISWSLTTSTTPSVQWRVRAAFFQLTGLPILMAVAMVWASRASKLSKPLRQARYRGLAPSA